MESIFREFAGIIERSRNLVFFGGAGVSTECGIPDFRSQNGLYHQKFDYSAEDILSLSFFKQKPEIFYAFLRESLLKYRVDPNKGHAALCELEKKGKLSMVITQNIDDLHRRAGSKKVLELHGSLSRFYCYDCKKNFEAESVREGTGVPLCGCGGVVRPDIVLYEEALSEEILDKAVSSIKSADTLIVAGTSLVVYPAAGLLHSFKGEKIVFINKQPTPLDDLADLVIEHPFAQTMVRTMEELGLSNR